MSTALIVDDDVVHRRLLAKLFRDHFPSLAVSEADGAVAAMRHVEESQSDVIFLDIHLGQDNGFDLLRRIRALGIEAVIVVLTSCDLPEYRETAIMNGANYFLSKGCRLEQILAIVASLRLVSGRVPAR